MESNLPPIGPALRRLRRPLGARYPRMTLDDLGKALGISQFLICKWERKYPGYVQVPDKHIRNICKVFRISRKKLFELAAEIAAENTTKGNSN